MISAADHNNAHTFSRTPPRLTGYLYYCRYMQEKLQENFLIEIIITSLLIRILPLLLILSSRIGKSRISECGMRIDERLKAQGARPEAKT